MKPNLQPGNMSRDHVLRDRVEQPLNVGIVRGYNQPNLTSLLPHAAHHGYEGYDRCLLWLRGHESA